MCRMVSYAGMNRFGDGRVPEMQAVVRKAAAEQGEQSRQTAQATRRTQESDGNKNTAREGGRTLKFSREDQIEFARALDRWDAEGRNKETFILGSTGEVLQGLGAIESDIYV